ncbi:MAG: hypothetical protein ACRCUM_02755 [Mycoplasmoidaceae bacterium]
MKEIKTLAVKRSIDESPAVKNSRMIADELARENYGAKDAKDFINSTNEKIKNGSAVAKSNAKDRAAQYVSKLSLLILYQEVLDSNSIGYMTSFTSMFNDGNISEGNSKQYIVALDTGNDVYDREKFVPNEHTDPLQENKTISMYRREGNKDVLNIPHAYQYKKSLTLTEAEWYPYFKAGELRKFIDVISAKMKRSYELFKFDKICSILRDLTPQKTINGTEANLFDCLSKEVFPEIEKMIKYNNDYNLDSTYEYTDALSEEDIVMVVGDRLVSRLKNGVETQLFNTQFFGPNSKPYNIVSLNNELVIGNSKTPISSDKTKPYVDDDTILVFDKNIMKSLIHTEKNESQSWAENMTIQLTLHVWGVIDTIPWAKIFKYVNKNLNVLP